MTARALSAVRHDSQEVAAEHGASFAYADRDDTYPMHHSFIVKRRGQCIYCGWPTSGWTCGSHRDLLALDVMA